MRHLSIVLILCLLPGCASLMTQPNLIDKHKEADMAYAAGNFEQSSSLYASLAQALPTDAGIRYQLGNSLARQGDSWGAIQGYREALLRDPQHARAWHNLLQVQLREALHTAAEMRQTLNSQQPMASRALDLGEHLLESMAPTRPGDVDQEP